MELGSRGGWLVLNTRQRCEDPVPEWLTGDLYSASKTQMDDHIVRKGLSLEVVRERLDRP